MNKKNKRMWILIAISCIIIFLLMLTSSVIELGEKLNKIHKHLDILFYILVGIILVFFIIIPIVKILKSPTLELKSGETPQTRKEKKALKLVAKNLIKNNKLSAEQVKLLKNYNSYEELILNLQVVFNDCVKGQLNEIIIRNSKTVLISTAICQNSKLDMFSVVACNTKMIKELVEKCGFKPSVKNLGKLTLNVFTTALIADGLESISIEDILPKNTTQGLLDIPLVKPVLSSVSNGIANALLTIRIGCVARRYLFQDGACITKEDIRKQAYKESLKLLPKVVSGTLTFIPKKIVNFFGKKKNETDENKDTVMAE